LLYGVHWDVHPEFLQDGREWLGYLGWMLYYIGEQLLSPDLIHRLSPHQDLTVVRLLLPRVLGKETF
jgi:hypothetical protein